MKKKTENQANKRLRATLRSTCFMLLLFATNVNAANFYWVGGSGNWNDFANHWATTSGGTTFHIGQPLPTDDVFFDANSFTGTDTVTINADIYCNNFSGIGITNPVYFKSPSNNLLNIYGNFNCSSLTSWGQNQSEQTRIHLKAATGLIDVNTNSAALATLYIEGKAVYNLGSDILVSLNLRVADSATFNTNNYKITALSQLQFDTQGAINTGSSKIIADDIIFYGGALNAANTSFEVYSIDNYTSNTFDIDSASATYMFGVFNCNYFQFAGSCLIGYHFPLQSGSPHTFIKKGVIGDLSVSTDIVEFDTLIINLPGGGIYVTDTLKVDSQLTILSNAWALSPIANGTIIIPSGALCADYLTLQNSNVGGGASFYAGTHSIDLGGNNGWNFTSCAPAANAYYWVGGTGYWNDFANHWATTSGGTTFHTGQPTPTDDVFFDANSFSSSDTVNLNVVAFCKNFNCSGISYPVLFETVSNQLNVYGNFTCDSLSSWGQNIAVQTLIYLVANTGTVDITTNGASLATLYITGSAQFNLNSDIDIKVALYISDPAIFNSNNYNIHSSSTIAIGSNSNIDFGTSKITAVDLTFTNNATVNASNATFVGYAIDNNSSTNVIPFDSITLLNTMTGTFHCNYLSCLSGLGIGYIGSLPINQHTIVKKGVLGGLSTSGFVEFDTLILPTVGGSILIDFDDTLLVNNQLSISSNASFLSTISSGTLLMPTGAQCFDYLKLSNSIVGGGATFYAGTHSIDFGGNSGWQFNSCAAAAGSVWPGDANYDLTANNNDVLNIGIAYGNTGPVRSGASLAWVAQPATDWANSFANGANHKHADTNGDGIVDNNDTTAITLNYGLTHPARNGADLSNSLVDPPLYLSALSDTLTEGDSVTVTISLGTAALPVTNIYGLAFTINFDNTVLDTNYIAFDFAGSWIGTPGVDLLTYTKQRSTDGAIDVAITRTSHTDTSGFGYAGRFGSVIVDNVGARLTSPSFMNTYFTISNVTAIHFDETVLPLTASGDSIVVDTANTTGIVQTEMLNKMVVIYPNPASDKLMVRAGNLKVNSLEIINSMGNSMLKQNNLLDDQSINTTVLSQGLYILKLQTEAGVVIKKFQVVKKKNKQ